LEIQTASLGEKTDVERRVIIKALLYSTRLQRLYFIVRASIMGLIGAAITIAATALLGTINVYEVMALGILSFVLSLIISRYFDPQVVRATRSIISHLANHQGIRDFIMGHF
jgi:cytochrome c biogenesis protein CcdA